MKKGKAHVAPNFVADASPKPSAMPGFLQDAGQAITSRNRARQSAMC